MRHRWRDVDGTERVMETAGRGAIASDIQGDGSSWTSRAMSDAKVAGQSMPVCDTHRVQRARKRAMGVSQIDSGVTHL